MRIVLLRALKVAGLLLATAVLMSVIGLASAIQTTLRERDAAFRLFDAGARHTEYRTGIPKSVATALYTIPQLNGQFEIPSDVCLNLSGLRDLDDNYAVLGPDLAVVQTLLMGGCAVTSDGIEKFPMMPYLRVLDLGWTKVDDRAVERLATIAPNLECLDLGGTLITDKAIQEIVKLRDLKCLWLDYCPHLTEQGIVPLRDSEIEVDLTAVQLSVEGLESLLRSQRLKAVVILEPQADELQLRKIVETDRPDGGPVLSVDGRRSIGSEFWDTLDGF